MSEKPILAIKYKLEAFDLWAGVRLTPGRFGQVTRWPVLGLIVLLSVLVEWVLREPHELTLAIFAAFGVGGAVVWVPSFQSKSHVQRAFRAIPDRARELSFTLFASSFRVQDKGGRVIVHPFSEVSAAVRAPEGILLYVGLRTFVLPRRALLRFDETEQFLEDLLGARFRRRPIVWDWEMAANMGIWAAATVCGVMYCL